MAVRTSMATLISTVRDLINDAAKTTFTDQQVQDKLDKTRWDVRYEQLEAGPNLTTLSPAGTFDWLDFYSRYQYWESDWVVNDGKWSTITPTSVEEITGHWVLPNASGQTNGQPPPVFVTGKVYDIYAAAADLLEMWAAIVVLSFDFVSDGKSLRRSQMSQQLLMLAKSYRCQALPRNSYAQRSDLAQTNSLTKVPLLGNNDVIGNTGD
jgi:hypothetical protein